MQNSVARAAMYRFLTRANALATFPPKIALHGEVLNCSFDCVGKGPQKIVKVIVNASANGC